MGKSFQVGDRVRDRITGFCGVVVQRMESLHGSPQCFVASTTLCDGKPVQDWFEEGRLESHES